MRGAPIYLAVALAVAGLGCGSAQRAGGEEGVEVSVKADRVGQALHLTVTGIGRGLRAGGAFENPRRWRVEVTSGDKALQHVVSGPARVARTAAGDPRGNLWDIEIRFSVGFAVPRGARGFDVVVTPPASRPKRLRVRAEEIPGTSLAAGR